MAEEITHLVYQNWTVQRSRVHVVGCKHYKKHGGGSERNSKWHYCSSYQEASNVMNSFGYEDTGDCSCVFESELVGKDFGLHEDTKRNEGLEDFIDELIKQSIEKGYTPLVFINMRNRYGTVKAIKRLAVSKDIQSGLRRLQELDLLHLSVERAVLEFPEKFTLEEQKSARWKLEQVGYDFDLEEKTSSRTSANGLILWTLTEEDKEARNRTLELARERDDQERREVRESVAKKVERHGQKEAERNQTTSPLHNAVMWGESLVEIKSLTKGADIEARNRHGRTPLHEAIWRATLENESRYSEIIDLLLKREANIETRDENGFTALHLSVAGSLLAGSVPRSVKIIKLLLSSGADTEARENYGYTPLHSVINEYKDIPNARDIIAMLLEHGADVNARDDDGNTPLHLAVSRVYEGEAALKVMELLLDKEGANINACDQSGNTPLHLVARFDGETAIKMMKLLHDRGAYINAQNKSGNSPLHLAVKGDEDPVYVTRNIEMVEALLDREVDAAIQNHAGKIPFDYIKGEEHSKKSDIYLRLQNIHSKPMENPAAPTNISFASGKPKRFKPTSTTGSAEGITVKGNSFLFAFVVIFVIGLVNLGEDINLINLILLTLLAGFLAGLWKILGKIS